MSDARSARSGRTCHTRSEVAASTTSFVRSEARRRAALSEFRAEQGQRAAAAKAERARQQAEQARQQAETSGAGATTSGAGATTSCVGSPGAER